MIGKLIVLALVILLVVGANNGRIAENRCDVTCESGGLISKGFHSKYLDYSPKPIFCMCSEPPIPEELGYKKVYWEEK